MQHTSYNIVYIWNGSPKTTLLLFFHFCWITINQDNEKNARVAEGMLAQSVLLELEKGDQVAVYAYHGNLRDGGWKYTHFTGYLIH